MRTDDGRPDDAVSAPRAAGAPELDAVPSERLGSEVVALARHLAADTYAMLCLVGEIDARGAYRDWGALNCATWLADACDLARSTAHRHVRVARAMRTWACLDAAMADGDVSYAKARMLVPHLSDANASELVRIARSSPVGGLGVAIAAWLHRHDDPEAIARRQHHARSVTWRTEPDGMITISARLEPAAGARVCAAIDRAMMAAPVGADDGDDGDGGDGAVEDARDGEDGGAGAGGRAAGRAGATIERPSLAQRRADGFARLVDGVVFGVGSGARGPHIDTEMVVHVTADGNHLTDGTPLADHVVTGMLPGSFVRLLLHDRERQPIDASPRRRFATPRQNRVLQARQRECAHPGCHATVFLEADHIVPYDDNGPTVLDNLRLMCGIHNRERVGRRDGRGPGRAA